MTTLTHNPLAEQVCMSWLAMARVNFPRNPITRPNIYFVCPFLQRAVEHGHALAMQLEVHSDDLAHELVDTPLKGRRLRLYLAAVEGELDRATHLEHAEQIVAIRNPDRSLKEEWK